MISFGAGLSRTPGRERLKEITKKARMKEITKKARRRSLIFFSKPYVFIRFFLKKIMKTLRWEMIFFGATLLIVRSQIR